MGFVMQANETVIKSQGQDDYGKIVALDREGKLDVSVLPDNTVNQNAFSNVVVSGTTISADSQSDTVELVAGTNIELAADATNEQVTIAVTGKVASAAQADSATSANSAVKLAAAHTINGVAFDGTADIIIKAEANGGNADTATKATTADSATTAESCTGNAATATKLAAARTISLSGDATGSATFDGLADATITVGVTNADKATKLETAHTINGVAFDGSANITITQVDGKDIATVDDVNSTYDAGHSFGVDGYQKLNNGLIIQWGKVNKTTVLFPVIFPVAFPSSCYNIVLTSGYTGDVEDNCIIQNGSVSTTGFSMYDSARASNYYVYWQAIGC